MPDREVVWRGRQPQGKKHINKCLTWNKLK
jgi:hypothetical protein